MDSSSGPTTSFLFILGFETTGSRAIKTEGGKLIDFLVEFVRKQDEVCIFQIQKVILSFFEMYGFSCEYVGWFVDRSIGKRGSSNEKDIDRCKDGYINLL